MNGIRAISFDLDDSLWAILPVIMRAEEAINAHCREHFPELVRLFDAEAALSVRQRVVEENRHLAHDFGELRRLTFAAMLEESGYDTAHADTLMDRFMAHRHDVEFFDDVLPALEKLGERYRLVSVSNGNADLGRVGLAQYFELQVSARDEGVGKPHPRIFHAACERLGLAPSEVLHIGDHPVEDVKGAMDAGLKAAWLNRAGVPWTHDFRPHISCSDLNEFTAIVLDSP